MAESFSALDQANKNAARNGGEEKTVKLLGMIEVPETVATISSSIWNEASHEFTQWIQRSSFPKRSAWVSP